jgi:imidazole glycerol phosphate synthase glutamine amidotransferase subunit
VTHVAIVDSGVANLASIKCAFERLAVDAIVTRSPAAVAEASHVVLPGVGSFAAGMSALRETGLDQSVKRAFQEQKPLLAVCLGMQLLGESSEESPGVSGLEIVPGTFRSLPDTVRVPHLGWNGVDAPVGAGLLSSGDAAFANSYCLTEPPTGWEVAWTTHGVRFVSALTRGRVLACQFHPELSSNYGTQLLERWLSGKRCGLQSSSALCGSEVARRIVPCLDVRDGRVVKGIKFQSLRDAGDPPTQAASYEQQGADEIVVLDVGATPESRGNQLETVRAVRAALSIPLTVGGGVRTLRDARELLSAGADKVSVNTAAVNDPALLTSMARAFGSQCVVLAIDARRKAGSWEVLVRGGRDAAGRDAIEWARHGTRMGAGEVLLTSWDRDGTRSGCDLELLRAATAAVRVPVIASGGIGTRADVAHAFRAGADAVLAASVFHDGDDTVAAIKSYLSEEGIVVRR